MKLLGGVLLIALFMAAGCNDSEQTGQPPNKDRSTEDKATPIPTTQAPSSEARSETPPRGAFHPVSLDAFYQRRFADYRPDESWAQVPQGETNFDGVPFLMLGKIDLTGLGRARDGEFQPSRVGEIPIGRRATRLHLMHGASYDSPDDTPVASLRLRYANGEMRSLFIRYGVHVRNWYVEANEANAELNDPRSFVVWTGNTRPDGSGKPTRLFKTTFDNPLPTQQIHSIDLLSLFARANAVILAITLDETTDSSAQGAPEAGEANDDLNYRREFLLHAVDAGTRQPVPSVNLRLSVTEGTRTYRFGTYLGDAKGEVRISYPPGRFENLFCEINSPGYLPTKLDVATQDGLFGPDLQAEMRKQPTP